MKKQIITGKLRHKNVACHYYNVLREPTLSRRRGFFRV